MPPLIICLDNIYDKFYIGFYDQTPLTLLIATLWFRLSESTIQTTIVEKFNAIYNKEDALNNKCYANVIYFHNEEDAKKALEWFHTVLLMQELSNT